MNTSMIDRIVDLLNRDLGKSRVIFLALERGQELIISISITGIMIICGHGSYEDACLRDGIGLRINVWIHVSSV
jgi:hypothetical protein